MTMYQISRNEWTHQPTTPAGWQGAIFEADPRATNVRYRYSSLVDSSDFVNRVYIFDFPTASWSLEADLGLPNFTTVGAADPTNKPLFQFASAPPVVYKNRIFFMNGFFEDVGVIDILVTTDILCNPGRQLNEYGDCIKCPEGMYGRDNICLPCSLGNSSLAGSGSCFQCPAGTFGVNGTLGGGICEPCPIGSFGNRTEQLSCALCDAGLTSSLGGQNCTPCTIGLYSNRTTNGVCRSCPLGQVPSQGASGCQLGTTTTMAGQFPCSTCNSSNVYSNASTLGLCVRCPRGSVAKADLTTCEPCPAGRYHAVENAAECVICPAGNTSSNGSVICSPCIANMFSNNGTGGECRSCMPPEKVLPNQTGCFMPAPPVANPDNRTSGAGWNGLQTNSSPFLMVFVFVLVAVVRIHY
jgi:hypothetical protein